MLRLVLKKDDLVKIGDDIVIRSMSEGRVSLAVDAPQEMRIDRVEASKLKADGEKKYIVVNCKK